jgi:hypothetical protein
MSSRQLDHLLAFHCAPALAGIKPANLICIRGNDRDEIEKMLRHYNLSLNRAGITLEVLFRGDAYLLVLVYRPSLLWKNLQEERTRMFLMRRGYADWNDMERILAHLKNRCCECRCPHEIGLFLGYPLEDVIGFIEEHGKNCKFCGYWKVYSDESEARTRFQQFTLCRKDLCRRVQNGASIPQIFGVALS